MTDFSRTLSERDVLPRDAAEALSEATDTGSASATVSDLQTVRQARALSDARRWSRSVASDMPRWMTSVFPAVQEFLRLPRGWDTYDGQPLKHETGMFALQLLGDVMTPRIPIPLSAPTSAGGIQLEWRVEGLDLDLCINAPYDCELTYRILESGEERSIPMTSDFSALTAWMQELQTKARMVG